MISARVRAGATLASMLRAHDVAVPDVAAIVAQAGAVFDLRKVRANQPYRLETTHAGTVRGFEWANPHIYIHAYVPNDKGGNDLW